MEIKSLGEDTMIVEACGIGGNRYLDRKSELTEQERIALHSA